MAEAVIAALIANPDDPEQRLVYADWLEQRGAATHAQLVRLGVERAALGLARATFGAIRGMRLHTAPEAERAEQLDNEMRALAADAEAQKQAALPAFDGVTWSGDLAFGGVPEGVSVERWATFAKVADTLAASAPVRSLALKRLDDRGAKALVTSGWLGRLRHLDLHGSTVGAKALEIVLASEQARSLWSIDLSLSQIKDRGAFVLSSSPYLAGLQSLCLYGAQIEDLGAAAITTSPHLRHLRGLNLEMNWLGMGAAHAFMADDLFPDIVHLNLFDNELLEEEPAIITSLRERWGEPLEI